MSVVGSRGPALGTSPDRLGRTARLDAGVRTLGGWTLWLALLLVTYWWVSGAGVQDLRRWGDALTSTGRLLGLWGSVLLLAQVLLMARVPVLEAAFGQDRLARLHRLTGFTSFWLVLAHVVIVTWGYAGGALARTPATLWDLVTEYPGVLLATGGLVAIVLVVVTSIRLARRRLRYESWHLLHLYGYLGVGLALPHQLWTGQDLMSSPARTVFWWTVWAAAAAAVLLWRIGLPLWRSARHHLTVTSVVPEGREVASVYLGGRHLDRMRVEAGEFLSWRFLTGPGWTRAHPYSLSAAPDGRSLRITVQAVGDGSVAALRLRPGTRALVEGPYGRLSARTRTRTKVALIGAGVGVTPLRSLAEGLHYAPGDAVLLQRCTGEPLFARELEILGDDRGLRVLTLPGPRRREGSWLGDLPASYGRVDDLTVLTSWVPDIAERDAFVCGPPRWTGLVRSTLLDAGVPADRIHLETFAW